MTYKKALIVLFFAILFSYMLMINFYQSAWLDNWSLPSYHSLINLIKHIYSGYFTWTLDINGAFICYFILQNTHNYFVFNVLNSLFFAGLVYAIFLLIYSRRPQNLNDLAMLLLILAVTWFLPVAFGEAILWKSTATRYFWIITAILFFIYPYKKLFENPSQIIDNFISRTGFFLIGLILVNSLHNLTLSICVLLLGILYYKKIRKEHIPVWAYTGIAGYILGTIIILIAPGNYARAKVSNQITLFHFTFIQKILLFSGMVILHFLPFIILCLTIFALKYIFKQKNQPTELRWFGIFGSLSLLTAFLMFGAPGVLFDGRVTFASDIFAILAMLSLLPKDNPNFFKKFLWPLLVFVILPYQIYDMVKIYQFYHQVHKQVTQRELLLKSMAPHSKKILVAPIYISHLINTFDKGNCINTGRLFVGDITSLDINNWRNSSAAKYYNLHSNSIALTPDVIFSESLPSTISNPKTPFDVTVYDHKIYYINTSKSCDSASKADFFVKVYPKHWYSNKLYYLDEFFDLQTRKAQMKKLYLVNKNIAFMLDSKAWFGLRDWHEIKSNSNNFDFTWESAYRATVLTNDFKPVANVCAIVVYLPDYAIDHIETGQIKNGSQLWKVIIHPKP